MMAAMQEMETKAGSQETWTLLVVEDDENDVLYIRRGLGKAGVGDHVRVARDAEEAVAYLNESHIREHRRGEEMLARAHGTLGVILAIALLGAAGCSTLDGATPFDPQDLDKTPGWVAVRTVPVILQQDKTDCGAASLSMVLAHWNVGTSLGDVVRHCPQIPEKGIRAKDLRDYAKSCGLQSYLIHGCWEDLGKELGLGHPLIVGLVKPDGKSIITHYEVVVAVHPELKSVVTLDPARGWSLNAMSGFCKEWEPAGFLTLVFFRGDPPEPEAGR